MFTNQPIYALGSGRWAGYCGSKWSVSGTWYVSCLYPSNSSSMPHKSPTKNRALGCDECAIWDAIWDGLPCTSCRRSVWETWFSVNYVNISATHRSSLGFTKLNPHQMGSSWEYQWNCWWDDHFPLRISLNLHIYIHIYIYIVRYTYIYIYGYVSKWSALFGPQNVTLKRRKGHLSLRHTHICI